MSRRFRLLFVGGCMLVLGLHGPRCLQALRGTARPVGGAPADIAALDPIAEQQP